MLCVAYFCFEIWALVDAYWMLFGVLDLLVSVCCLLVVAIRVLFGVCCLVCGACYSFLFLFGSCLVFGVWCVDVL